MGYINEYKLITILVTILFICACTEEKSEFEDQVYGRWELKEALRNDRPAASLENIFFEFYDDGKMITNFNISGDVESSDYKIVGNRIRQKNDELSPEYIIDEVDDSTLVITTELRNFDFRLTLRKDSIE